MDPRCMRANAPKESKTPTSNMLYAYVPCHLGECANLNLCRTRELRMNIRANSECMATPMSHVEVFHMRCTQAAAHRPAARLKVIVRRHMQLGNKTRVSLLPELAKLNNGRRLDCDAAHHSGVCTRQSTSYCNLHEIAHRVNCACSDRALSVTHCEQRFESCS